MIKAMVINGESVFLADVPKDLKQILSVPENLVWLDFHNEAFDLIEPVLSNVFGFHFLAIDDALQESHVPKIDDWGTYIYMVLHEPVFLGKEKLEICTNEVDFFIGKNFVVTIHDDIVGSLNKSWNLCARNPKTTASHLLYTIADCFADKSMVIVEEIDDAIEEVEDIAVDKPTTDLLRRILELKRSLLVLRRNLSYQREVLGKLARDSFTAIALSDRIYFRDIYDHYVRLYDISENLRDIVTGTIDIYMSAINRRMNDIMKTLTVFATLFMPLTFLTGFFGMNFFEPLGLFKTWTGYLVFILCLVLVVGSPIAMLIWMSKRRWV
jgi:magnesium transporter